MRCLYCGNELALLRKLTGYGEFCSEAHRQKYQEQYNRLALTRLLQAQDTEPERRPLPAPLRAATRAGTLGPGQARKELEAGRPEERQAPPSHQEWTAVSSASPASRLAANGTPPDISGFLPHPFEPAVSHASLCSAEPLFSPPSPILPASFAVPDSAAYSLDILGHAGWETPASTTETVDVRAGATSPSASTPPLAEPGPLWGILDAAKPLDLALVRVNGVPIRGETMVPFEFVTEFDGTVGDLSCLTDDPTAAVERRPDPASPPEPPPRTGPVATQPLARPSGISAAADKSLAQAPGPGTGRPPVVINWAALGMTDPDLEENPAGPEPLTQIPSPVAVELPTGEVMPAPAAASPLAPEDTAGGALDVAIEPPAITRIRESKPEPILPAGLASPPPADQPLAPVPVLCDAPALVHLPLADGAFTPNSDGEFESPLFDIRIPPTVTCPLRPKLVFGPSPRVADSATLPTVGTPEPTAAVGGAELPVLAATNAPSETDTGQPPDARREPGAEPRAVVNGPLASQPAPPPRLDKRRPLPETTDLEALRLEMEHQIDPAGIAVPTARRVAVLVALLLAILLVVYLVHEALGTKAGAASSGHPVEAFGPGLITGEGGWSVDWAGQTPGAVSGRQVYIFRPSLAMSDYRFEFQGQIESKGLGWIFRAANPRNYYAMKLEMTQAGLSPKVVLSRMAVINGEETQKVRTELHIPVHLDTVYKIHTDVFGSTFKTYVQDELADTWVDDRLGIGGIGLLRDRDEAAEVRLIQLHELRAAK